MEQKRYEKTQIATVTKMSKELIDNAKLRVGLVDDDFIANTLTVQMESYLYARTAEIRKLHFDTDRPTFMDWLFRRTKHVVFEADVKDILLDVPKDMGRAIIIRDNSGNELV